MDPAGPDPLDPARFCCSICLELLRDPVSLACGHSFCMSCLSRLWDRQEVCSCPLCRVTFRPRPALARNTLLHDTVRSLAAVKLGPSVPPPSGFQHATFDIGAVCGTSESRLEDAWHRQVHQTQTDVETLKQNIKSFSRASKGALKDVSRTFSELQDFLEGRRVEVKELIRAHEQSEVTRAQHVLQGLQRHLAELKRLGPGALEENLPQLARRCPPVVAAPASFLDVRSAVCDLTEELQSVYRSRLPRVTSAVRDVSVLPDPDESTTASPPQGSGAAEPESRRELLQHLRPLTLDPFSAHCELRLRDGNRLVERSDTLQPYPEHPDRFDSWVQVLCREGLRGRSYWEAEWSGQQVALGLAYQSIGRKGSSDSSRLGHNSASWCVRCNGSSVAFEHGGEERTLAPAAGLARLGVLLDHGAGLIRFYAVTGGDCRLLHCVAGRFTEPLYAAVWVGAGGSVRLCHSD